jgi:hypothetical protein
MTREIIYLGRNNTIERILRQKRPGEGWSLVPLTQVTRMQAVISSVTIDSQASPDCFDWETYGADAIVSLALGGVAALSAVSHADALTLVVFDADHPSGLFWDTFPIKIVT